MTRKLTTIIFLLIPLLHAETAAILTIPASCPATQSAARPFFSQRSLILIPDPICPTCFTAKTSDLHDANAKRVPASRAMRLYMQPTTNKSNPITWYAHSHIDTTAQLSLNPEGTGCRAALLFHFSWYTAQFVTVFPVDGDTESRPSNLHLEKLYLDELAKFTSPSH
jgi:hypothetical protein